MLIACEIKTLAHKSKPTKATFVQTHMRASLEPVNVLLLDAFDSLFSPFQLAEVELASSVREVLPFETFLDNTSVLHIHFKVRCV